MVSVAVGTVVLTSCGQISIGTSASPTDPTPTGTVVGAGTFTSQNGQTVTGSVTVYQTDPVTWVVHLDGLSAPNEPGLQMAVVVSPTPPSQPIFTLRAFTGSQNYTITGLGVSPRFSEVDIRSATVANNPIYGVAVLH
jgi:hypothetical protein